MLLVLLITKLTFLLLLMLPNRRPKNYPPGPFSLPIVGNVLQLGLKPHVTFMKLKEKYGDIMAIQLGSKRFIVLNDYKIIKEAFSHPSLNGRPHIRHSAHIKTEKMRGVILTEGSEWVEQRRFMRKNLREFGFGKKSMESLIQDEVSELVDNLRKGVQEPISTEMIFNIAVVNALWSIATGERYSHDDPKINQLIELINRFLMTTKAQYYLFMLPSLNLLPDSISGHDSVIEIVKPIYDFIQTSIDSHKKTYQPGSNRDLIDCYLEEISKASDSSSFFAEKGDHNMLHGVFDLFLAGAETTSKTLTWVCFLLCHFPECQTKLNKKIEEVVGQSRLPCLEDRQKIPYAEAVILEVLRFSSIGPLGVMHMASEDVEFHGYTIPKGTLILPNLYGVLHDPKVWGDPETFRPERFLSPDEKCVVRHEALIPFSTGKRVCLGESLARDELFLFTTALFQRFRMEIDQNSPRPPFHLTIAPNVLVPEKHKIVLYDRYDQ